MFDSAGVNAYKEAKEEEALQPMLVAQMKQVELQRPMWEAMMSTMIPDLAMLVKPAPVPPEPHPCRELEYEDVSGTVGWGRVFEPMSTEEADAYMKEYLQRPPPLRSLK